jgi:hypothetical protein
VETLAELPEGARPSGWLIESAPSSEARETAELLRVRLKTAPTGRVGDWPSVPESVAVLEDLDPLRWTPFGGEPSVTHLNEQVTRLNDWPEDASGGAGLAGRLCVLHDPHAAWVLRELAGSGVNLSPGGLAWLVERSSKRLWGRRPRWRLWSTIEEFDDATKTSVVEKVKTKYATAGAVGVFLTGVFLFLGGAYADRVDEAHAAEDAFWWLAMAMIAIGAGLNFLALFEYDRLLMPTRFWGPGRSPRGPEALRKILPADPLARDLLKPLPGGIVRRPPGGSPRLVIQSAQRVWSRFVAMSAVFLLVGLAFFAAAITRPTDGCSVLLALVPLVAAGFVGVGLVLVWRWFESPIGASD